MHRISFVLLFTLFLLLLLLPKTALAQSEPTLRFDLMGGVMGGNALSTRVSAASIAPVLKLDLGVQLSEQAAIYARVEGGTSVFTNEGAAYLVSEWTPVPLVSLGTGIGYDGMSLLWVGGGGCEGTCIKNSWSGVSVPFVLGFELPHRARTDGKAPSRGKVRFEIEAAGGYDPMTATWGEHLFVGVGGAWR